VPKIDSLYKHARRQRALADIGKVEHGEFYYLGIDHHVKNERILYAKGRDLIVQKNRPTLFKSGGEKWFNSRPFL
jgi:hypothetical protein